MVNKFQPGIPETTLRKLVLKKLHCNVRPVTIECKDKMSLSATLFFPEEKTSSCDYIVICAALGVSQTFYHGFAVYLCSKGYGAVTFDFRGTGGSKGMHNDNPKLSDWAVQDMEAVISYVLNLPGSNKAFLVGHSVGGQLFCLSESSGKLSGAVLVAASFPYWKRWAFPRKWLMFIFFFILIPVLGIGKTFPTKRIGLSSQNMPSSLINDWGRWARHPDYAAAPKFKLGTDLYQKCRLPILSFGFDDDTYAPVISVERLLNAFEQADIKNIIVKGSERNGMGHFGFFRQNKSEDLWSDVIRWIKQNTKD